MKIDQINVFHVSQLALDTNLNQTGAPLSSSWIVFYCINANKSIYIIDL